MKNVKEEKGKNVIVKEATLNWAKLDPNNPVSPFGAPQWELQIATTDKEKADQWISDNLIVKETDGVYTVGLKRKAHKFDGSEQTPVNVVDGMKNPIDMTRIKIANGSVGNVILWVYPWETAGKSGWASSLKSLQVTELIEYTSGPDFDIEGPTDGLTPMSKSSMDLDGDDIPDF